MMDNFTDKSLTDIHCRRYDKDIVGSSLTDVGCGGGDLITARTSSRELEHLHLTVIEPTA
jgi:2-polyprenyl-3-methyl-5-hydroxy-6-metoxy-1,4-benzoquinol methylase